MASHLASSKIPTRRYHPEPDEARRVAKIRVPKSPLAGLSGNSFSTIVTVVPELKLNTSDPFNLTLSWEGDAQLLFTEDLSAGFEAVAGATSPYTIEQVSMGFYILRVEP
jgi:hypothetical protein